jgi:putative spermidine/putrescine transport system ATP-binding protein
VEIRTLQQRLGLTTLFVTHDQEEALTMADRLVVREGGRVRQVGTAEELYERPADLFVANFIGRVNALPGEVAGPGEFRTTDGTTLPCPRDATPGRATLCLRPEKLRFQPWASAGMPARLERMVYLGGQTEYHFTLAGLPVLALRETPPEGDRLRSLRPGDQVTLDWLGEDARLLPEAAR